MTNTTFANFETRLEEAKMQKQYTEYKGLNMPAIEESLLKDWKENEAFLKSVSQREGAPSFVFYEGPPSANGLPGIHHVISRTLKDLVCRYKTMKGFQVNRKAGWDTHGLPVELGVEKDLGITKEDIGTKISVEDYNQKCREAVMRYKKEWDSITEKMGYWVNLDEPYVTFENKYIESLWWALKELYKKDLLYKSVSIQPYSPAAGTGLSSHELNQPGTYKDVKDTTVVAMFKMASINTANQSENAHQLYKTILDVNPNTDIAESEVYFMAWTTTPWTLPSNCGLTVGSDIDYVLVKTFNPYTHQPINVVLARNLVAKYFTNDGLGADFDGYQQELQSEIKVKKPIPYTVLSTFKGKDLEGIRYEQLMPFDANRIALSEGDPFRVILGDFVTTVDGTGIVHTSPAFGADDYKVGKKAGLGMFTLVDRQGKFVEGTGVYSGRFVKNYNNDMDYTDVDIDIAVELKLKGLAFKVEKYEHTYPHCWRTDKPIIYYPLDAWFIRTTAVKERMIELNKTINWKPKSTGEGRFGNWLENMVDWNLSRSRFWGTPLPIWVSEDGREKICIGSVKELVDEMKKADKQLGLNQLADYTGHENPTENDLKALMEGVSPTPTKAERYRLETPKRKFDLHKPYVDTIVLVDSQGKAMNRETDLIDVWFDSGAMPYAQWHYPFENKEAIDNGKAFPADFIAEGVDQTRGWFYTLHALGVLLFDKVAYKTVVSNGLVLDKNGNKMSKRVGNVVDPFKTIATYSADATRWYLMTNASPWDSLKFDEKGIEEVQRKFFGTIYNTYQFFSLYANVDGFTFSQKYLNPQARPEIDRWILSELNTLIEKVSGYMDDFEPTLAGRAISYFVDEQLSNWYVRLCRRRFWKGAYEEDKVSAYQTLYECLETISLLIAPISPFFADWLFRNLNGITHLRKFESVHHANFPDSKQHFIDKDLEERMALAQNLSSIVLSIRKKVNIKVRQPLQKILIPVFDENTKLQIQKVSQLICSEVNVKEVDYISDNTFISKQIKPLYKALGAKLGSKMKAAASSITEMTATEIATLEKEGEVELLVNGELILIELSDVEILAKDIPGWSVGVKSGLTVALDVHITPELASEGVAREFVNRMQKLRKDTGLAVTDQIIVKIDADNNTIDAIMKYKEYICAEILAKNIEFQSGLNGSIEVEVNESKLEIIITKI